jgi:hypothetical protein
MYISLPRLLFLEKYRIQKDGRPHQNGLLFHGGGIGEVHFECIGVGKELGREGLGLFQDLTQMGGITAVRVGLFGIEHPERDLAAPLSEAGIALRAAVHAHPPAAGGRVEQVQGRTGIVGDVEAGDAEVARLLHRTQLLAPRRHGGLLVQAALARTGRTGTGTLHREEFGLGTLLIHPHREGVDGTAMEGKRNMQAAKQKNNTEDTNLSFFVRNFPK